MARLEARETPIHKIFSNDYHFVIPPYQRPYSWTTEEAGQLLDDLLDWLDRESSKTIDQFNPYFLGSIVLIKEDKPYAEVIDGQQRLTTLTLLLAAARQRMPSLTEHITSRLKERGDPLLGTRDRFRLLTRERDHELYINRVLCDSGIDHDIDPATLSDSQRNLLVNARFFEKHLADLANSRVKQVLEALLQQCYLVVVTTPDFSAAFRIFSVLNDRGLDLAPTDILKAQIIGDVPATNRSTYTEKWEDTEEELGRDGFLELFAHIRTIHKKTKLRRTLVDELREDVVAKFTATSFIDEQVVPYADALKVLEDADYESSSGAETVNAPISHLHLIDNVDWLPPAIAFLRTHRHNTGDLSRFLTDLERLAASMMIRRDYVNVRVERYGRVLHAIENGDDLYADDAPLQLTPLEKQATLAALDGDIYGQVKLRRPLLLRLDGLLADAGAKYDYNVITIEHVLPQNPSEGSDWLKKFPDDEVRLLWTNRLANLTLLSRRKNSQASNYDFDRKKREYFTKGTTVTFALTAQVLAEPEWNEDVLKRRQPALIKKLSDAWRLA